MTLQGAGAFAQKLAKLAANSSKMGPMIYAAADAIKATARHSITQGATQGKYHIASRPGEPPNRDTGHLDTNIEAFKTGPLSAEVRSQAEYAAYLEYGTSKMAERPYMRPAVKANQSKIKELASASVKRIVRES